MQKLKVINAYLSFSLDTKAHIDLTDIKSQKNIILITSQRINSA